MEGDAAMRRHGIGYVAERLCLRDDNSRHLQVQKHAVRDAAEQRAAQRIARVSAHDQHGRFLAGFDKGAGGRGILNGTARDLQRRVLEGKSAELAVKLDLTLLADGGQGRRPWIPRCAQAMRERPKR